MGKSGQKKGPTGPVHLVQLDSFAIGTHEITLGDWESVYNWALENGYAFDYDGTQKGSVEPPTSQMHPMVNISWHDMLKWCNARSEMEELEPVYFADTSQETLLRKGSPEMGYRNVKWNASGYRLPTEAQWEYAARGGLVGKKYPNGDTLTEADANVGSSKNKTRAVGGYAPNGYGLHDMAGNAWEACWDWYGKDYYATFTETAINPTGPEEGALRVVRGGSARKSAKYAEVAYRKDFNKTWFNYPIGFRVVLPVARAGFRENVPNRTFYVENNELKLKGVLDVEFQTEYLVQVTATDSGGLSITKEFVIEVVPGNRELVARYLFGRHDSGDIPNELGPDFVAIKQGPGEVLAGTGEFGLGLRTDDAWWKIGPTSERFFSHEYDSGYTEGGYGQEPLFDPGPDHVRIEGGIFTIGNPSASRGPEGPAHEVELSTFYMERTEVTKAHFEEVYQWALRNGYGFDYLATSKGTNRVPLPPTDEHPMVGLTWGDMLKWCNARSEMEGRPAVYYADNQKKKSCAPAMRPIFPLGRWTGMHRATACLQRQSGRWRPVEAVQACLSPMEMNSELRTPTLRRASVRPIP